MKHFNLTNFISRPSSSPMKMRYKLRSSLGAGASPGEKKKSTKKKPKCKAKKGVPTKKEGDESKRQNPNFEIAEETIRDSSTLEELEIKEVNVWIYCRGCGPLSRVHTASLWPSA